MKPDAISKKFFSPEQIAAAIAAAPEHPVEDKNNPPTRPEDWDDPIVSHSYEELQEKLAERRRMRGPQKEPTKELVDYRINSDRS